MSDLPQSRLADVKESASSTQRHKDTKKENKVICPGMKPCSPAPGPKYAED